MYFSLLLKKCVISFLDLASTSHQRGHSRSLMGAMQRLDGRTSVTATPYPFAQKSEALPDTIGTIGCYADSIVLRHPEESYAEMATKQSLLPAINAGSSIMEHAA